MSDDLLARATRALRESAEDEAAPPPVLETRHRVLTTLRRKRSNRVVWLRRILPIAAVLVTSSAWAAANGHLGGTMRQVAAYVGLGDAEKPSAPPAEPQRAPIASGASPASVAPSSSVAEASAPPETPALPTAPPEAAVPVIDTAPAGAAAEPSARSHESAHDAATRARPVAERAMVAAPPHVGSAMAARPSSSSPRGQASAASAPPGPAPSADDPAQSLYTAAHQKHFAERDFAGALAAWETYLRAAPGGRFAAEAHYNRAICLVRLGRSSEARAALQAFADGGYGGYRQSEAKALLEALHDP